MQQQQTTTVNSLFLTSLLLAEITRLKYGSKFSLTRPEIERNARKQFAKLVGISERSKPEQFISQIRRVHAENGSEDSFLKTIARFGLSETQFPI